jgi:hypothetical protein
LRQRKQKVSRTSRQAFARIPDRARAPGDDEISLISSNVFESRALRARCVLRSVARAVLLGLHVLLLLRDASRARRIHTSLSRTLFFSLCCSKRNAVRVDSRHALMRHPPCYMARRAAMAKRRKKAVKAAKKTKKRKKRI